MALLQLLLYPTEKAPTASHAMPELSTLAQLIRRAPKFRQCEVDMLIELDWVNEQGTLGGFHVLDVRESVMFRDRFQELMAEAGRALSDHAQPHRQFCEVRVVNAHLRTAPGARTSAANELISACNQTSSYSDNGTQLQNRLRSP